MKEKLSEIKLSDYFNKKEGLEEWFEPRKIYQRCFGIQ